MQTFTMTLTWEKGEQAEISNGTANNIAEIKYTSKGYLIYSYEYIVAHAALGILIVLLKMKLSLNRMAMELVNICLIKYRKLN